MTWLLIGAGGAVGSLLRYGIALAMRGLPVAFLGTLLVNVLGSFALVFIAELHGGRTLGGVELRLVLGTGMMGGFTTYSTFNFETYRLLEQGHGVRALLYVVLTLVGCLAAAALAMHLVRTVRA